DRRLDLPLHPNLRPGNERRGAGMLRLSEPHRSPAWVRRSARRPSRVLPRGNPAALGSALGQCDERPGISRDPRRTSTGLREPDALHACADAACGRGPGDGSDRVRGTCATQTARRAPRARAHEPSHGVDNRCSLKQRWNLSNVTRLPCGATSSYAAVWLSRAPIMIPGHFWTESPSTTCWALTSRCFAFDPRVEIGGLVGAAGHRGVAMAVGDVAAAAARGPIRANACPRRAIGTVL